MTEIAFTPWSTAAPLFRGSAPGWVPEEHAQRVQAYQLYEQMYWQQPNTFKLQQRGTDSQPIYIPNPRTIVDTINRYVGKDLRLSAMVDPNPAEGQPAGSEQVVTQAQSVFTALFRRERWFSRYVSNKLYGLMRGDYLWHVYADPLKPEGRRITVQTINPASYYPIYDDQSDLNSLRSVILADLVLLGEEKKEFVRRQRYTKVPMDDGTTQITTELAYFKPDKWFPRAGQEEPEPENVPNVTVIPPTPLDPRIQALPVYHIQNNPGPNEQFGNSELRGLERVMAAVNQSISDEDLVLVLEGLGVYATDAGPPVDDEGNETNWLLGPGRVLELNNPESRFMRVNGVSTVGPFQDHIKYLEGKAEDAVGANAAARGEVDVQVAESGIALILRLSPMLSRAEYMETFITDTTAQLWFDLQTGWYPTYESLEFPGIVLQPTYGNKLPTNRKELFDELLAMLQAGIIDEQFVRDQMQQFGYQFPADIGTRALAAMQARTQAQTPTDALSGAQPTPQEEPV